MTDPIELSTEQQFNLASFKSQVNQMSQEQAQDSLIKLHRQMMIRETMFNRSLRQSWGMDDWQGLLHQQDQ